MSASAPKLVITLATKNQGKQQELQRWLMDNPELSIELVLNDSAIDVEESGRTFLENARLKAQGTPPVLSDGPDSREGYVLAEDSGMVVDALDGRYGISPFPGIYSNRWMTPEVRDALLGCSYPNRMPLDRTYDGVTNTDLCYGILKLLEGESNRQARYCCGMVLWHPRRGVVFEALESTELTIIESEPRGTQGFGYDPITCPAGEIRTMAELSVEEKNRISHRGKAFRKLLDFLAAEIAY